MSFLQYLSQTTITQGYSPRSVSAVSTGPLFPSPMVCLASPNRANAPMARTQRGDMLQHNTRWLRTVRKAESSNNFPFSQAIYEGVACEISERSESRNQCYTEQRAERVDVHACKTLSSGLRRALFWPGNGLRSNLMGATVKAGTQERGTERGMEIMWFHTGNYTEMMQEL